MEMMNIESIKINNKYLRLDGDVDELMRSIQEVGVINPITVNKGNELVAGGRRYTALKNLGEKQAPVKIVDEGVLKEELISIDENIIRKGLTKVEFEKCLARGKEIFESLHPDLKEDIDEEKDEELEQIEVAPENETFITRTAKKTGLSENVIRGAIKRDIKSTDLVKQARNNGELSVGLTNQLIELEESDQNELLPHIKEKAGNVVKQIIKDVKTLGVNEAIQKTMDLDPLTKNFLDIKSSSRRLARQIEMLLKEESLYSGQLYHETLEELKKASSAIERLQEIYESNE